MCYIFLTIKVSKMTKVTSQALYKKNIEIKEKGYTKLFRNQRIHNFALLTDNTCSGYGAIQREFRDDMI